MSRGRCLASLAPMARCRREYPPGGRLGSSAPPLGRRTIPPRAGLSPGFVAFLAGPLGAVRRHRAAAGCAFPCVAAKQATHDCPASVAPIASPGSETARDRIKRESAGRRWDCACAPFALGPPYGLPVVSEPQAGHVLGESAAHGSVHVRRSPRARLLWSSRARCRAVCALQSGRAPPMPAFRSGRGRRRQVRPARAVRRPCG